MPRSAIESAAIATFAFLHAVVLFMIVSFRQAAADAAAWRGRYELTDHPGNEYLARQVLAERSAVRFGLITTG